jgi:CRP-like cAMP-binding protein
VTAFFAHNATVVALDPVETLVLLGEAFDELRLTRPAVDRMLVHGLVTEVRRLSALLVEAHYVAADKRIYLPLADLSRIFSGAGDDGPVLIPLTQEELAQLAGIARPTANRVLRAAEEVGALRVARGRMVPSPACWASGSPHAEVVVGGRPCNGLRFTLYMFGPH